MHWYIYFLSLCRRSYPRRGGRRHVGRRHRSLWATKTQETHTKTQTSSAKTPCAYWTNFEMSQVPFQLAKLHKVSTNPVHLRNSLPKNQSWLHEWMCVNAPLCGAGRVARSWGAAGRSSGLDAPPAGWLCLWAALPGLCSPPARRSLEPEHTPTGTQVAGQCLCVWHTDDDISVF